MVKEVCIRAVCIPASFRGYEDRSEYGGNDEPHTIGTVSMDMWTKEKGKQYISRHFLVAIVFEKEERRAVL